jgi:cold shock CspA family protein
VLAELLFLRGKSQEAADLFQTIAKRAPDTFRQRIAREDDLVTARLGRYTGLVATHREQFLFVKSGAYPDDIFAHQRDSAAEVFEELKVGAGANFRLRFNRNGPCAVDLKPGR